VPAPAPAAGTALIDLLSTSGVTIDELVRVSGLATSEVQAQIVDLELQGRLVRMAGGMVARAG
jgi:predicted Rossmann fold nucleotide-binding protein DprA/Smf involved in DNA uptake